MGEFTEGIRNAKVQQIKYANCTEQIMGEKQVPMCGMGLPDTIPYSLAGEAEEAMKFHAESHKKSYAAHEFLVKHPEFDEFIRLVRSGSIQF